SYTVDTIRELKAQYAHDELFLMMGTDMFLSFQDWYSPQEIARCAQLVC
ncbi:MAG TPA: nicotinate-nucleotide adenylyltransferase, partial [Clostridiales bacterium]|nr:nicotinate-nucleotide adenylyltransferase [Clostridiales bacterium]